MRSEKRLAGGGGGGEKSGQWMGTNPGVSRGGRGKEREVAGAVLEHPYSAWLQELSKRIWMEAKATGSTASAGMSS